MYIREISLSSKLRANKIIRKFPGNSRNSLELFDFNNHNIYSKVNIGKTIT